MSGRIPQHFIDELVARADIIEVIGSRVPLKKGGKEYKACCPFHDEKSPSFTVVPDKQFYHCFGCGAHGTALGFLMEYDHLGFVEAVEELAARVGLEVPREQDATIKPKPADDLFAVLDQVAEFYRRQFRADPRVTDYARRRGLTEDTLARFGIGYAPNAWDALLKAFGKTEADQKRLLQAGLVIERERRGAGEPGDASQAAGRTGYYDRFRDRLMFPIRDSRGRTLGFGGRIIDQGEPKYLNSPETELFHKGRELYGLYEARQATRNLTRLMVVEGYMDVARLHQAGITYAVATLGTATTPDHLQRLFRIVNEVVFCFDGDRAGKAAAWRALENALPQVRQGRQIRFLFLPDGHDPDSLVGEEGRDAFEARLKGALSFSDYFIRELSSRVDIATVDGRAQLAETARPLVEKIPPGVYRELLVDALARVVGMAPEKLESLMSLGSQPKGDSPAAPRPGTFGTPGHRPPPPRTALGTGRGSLVRQAVRLLVHHPSIATEIAVPAQLKSIDQPGSGLLNQLLEQLRAEPCASMAVLLVRWRDHPDFDSLDKLSQQETPTDKVAAKAELEGALQRLIADYPRQRTQWLLDKERTGPLSQDERKELQILLSAPRSADTART